MPNRDVHVPVGIAVGGITAITSLAFEQKTTDPSNVLFRLLGGLLGGFVGARMPDVIDPSSNGPNHRSIGHGVLPISLIVYTFLPKYLEFRQRQLANEDTNPEFTNFWVGFADGFGTSYLSHLALDSVTPKGLPLIA